jgi:hypothetical protein
MWDLFSQKVVPQLKHQVLQYFYCSVCSCGNHIIIECFLMVYIHRAVYIWNDFIFTLAFDIFPLTYLFFV